MIDYDKNVYYNPENSGLDIVELLEEPGLSYEFNMLLVVRHIKSKRVFYATSSGCSCPSPFEEYYFNDPNDTDLTEITLANFSSFESEVDNFPVPMNERSSLIDDVKQAMKR